MLFVAILESVCIHSVCVKESRRRQVSSHLGIISFEDSLRGILCTKGNDTKKRHSNS